MTRGPGPDLMWGLGLSEADAAIVREVGGERYQLVNFALNAMPDPMRLRLEHPILIWIPASVWREIPESFRMAIEEWETPLRTLVFDDCELDMDFDGFMAEGFLTAVRSPLTRETVQDIFYRVQEISGLYTDIMRMSKEILLEREIVARKSDQLIFLQRAMSGLTNSRDPQSLLTRFREELAALFPCSGVQACLFSRGEDGEIRGEVWLDNVAPEDEAAWADHMLDNAASLVGRAVPGAGLHVGGCQQAGARAGAPGSERAVVLPLTAGGKSLGCLALCAATPVSLARDQRETMLAAVAHVGLLLHGLTENPASVRCVVQAQRPLAARPAPVETSYGVHIPPLARVAG